MFLYDLHSITTGVPPVCLWFLLWFLKFSAMFSTKLHAGDKSLTASGCDVDRFNLQTEINPSDWLCCSKLTLNLGKTK